MNEASDGEKALGMLHGGFGLIICDRDMPRMNGLEFLQAVRADASRQTLPFIMLTANAGCDHVGQAIAAGVSDYITKPFKPADLVRKISRMMR